MLVALSLMAILLVPTMGLFSSAMSATDSSRDSITAVSLARWEMERVKNLGVRPERLVLQGNVQWPPEGEEAFQLNGQTWRVFRKLKKDSAPLEVAVEVCRAAQPEKPVVRLVTLVVDTLWSPPEKSAP